MGGPLNLPPHMRPRYTDEALWDQLLNEMAHGKAFTSALRDCAGAPSYPVAKRMLAADPALPVRYRAALEDRADSLRDPLLDLADAPIPDTLEGAEKSAWLAPLKSRLNTRRYLASKLFPRQYGERLEVGVMHQISILAALDAANGRAGIAREG
ncbi:MAG: hypothetical protein EXR83_00735 [Gammaproteobacteria bacterium]|nr:hypothetical protein [Gammaproteobacteria bacterium]